MFGLVRMAFGCVIFLCLVFILKKVTAVPGYKKHIISLSATVLLVTISAFIPFENLVITFNSPESAYKYVNSGTTDIQLVVNGDNSDLVIGAKHNSDDYLIVPKTAQGWKVGLGIDTKLVKQKIVDGIIIYVYQYGNSSDYFLTIMDTNGGAIEISDIQGSEFIPLERISDLGEKSFITYYTYIPNLDEQYRINLNGSYVNLLGT